MRFIEWCHFSMTFRDPNPDSTLKGVLE